jgi:hypothetical protein
LVKLEQEVQLMIERQVAKASLLPRAYSPPASPTPPSSFPQKHSTSSASDAEWQMPQSESKNLVEIISELEIKIEALEHKILQLQNNPPASYDGPKGDLEQTIIDPPKVEAKVEEPAHPPGLTIARTYDYHQGNAAASDIGSFDMMQALMDLH